MIDLARQWRAGKLELFAPPRKPGPVKGSAPAKDRVRGRIIQLRRQGLSSYEISARLAAEKTPLNRTSVAEVLAEEGFGRLQRVPAAEASHNPATAGRDTGLPRTGVLDFTHWPERCDSTRAGLLLVLPDLVNLDLPALVTRAGYPGTKVVAALSWLLSLLALKLTRTRRVSHVDDLLADPAAALLAGLAVLPKKSALTAYSYRLSHDHQQHFLAALDQQMVAHGLAGGGEAIFDLDFHAVMHRGHDPALEKHYVPTRSQRPAPCSPSSPKTAAPTTSSTPTPTCPKPARPKQRLAEIIRAFYADALSSTVNLNVDLDIMLAVLAQALLAALRTRLPGYGSLTPDVIQRRFLETPGQITTNAETITVRLERRAYTPLLRKAALPDDTRIPWLDNRIIRYQLT